MSFHYCLQESFNVTVNKEYKIKNDWYIYDLIATNGKFYKFSINTNENSKHSARLAVDNITLIIASIYYDEDHDNKYMELQCSQNMTICGKFLVVTNNIWHHDNNSNAVPYALKPWDIHKYFRPKQFSTEIFDMPYLNQYKNEHNRANETYLKK